MSAQLPGVVTNGNYLIVAGGETGFIVPWLEAESGARLKQPIPKEFNLVGS